MLTSWIFVCKVCWFELTYFVQKRIVEGPVSFTLSYFFIYPKNLTFVDIFASNEPHKRPKNINKVKGQVFPSQKRKVLELASFDNSSEPYKRKYVEQQYLNKACISLRIGSAWQILAKIIHTI